MKFKNLIRLKIILCLMISQSGTLRATSSVERMENKNQILEPAKPREDRIIQAGVYHDYLYATTKTLFTPSSMGILLSFQHKLWSFWRGSLEARWSHWIQDINPKYVMPLCIFSKIALEPNFKFAFFSFSPYMTAGIGYMIPFQGNSYVNLHVPKQFGQVSAIVGGGLAVLIVKSFGINAGFDAWKGLESTEYLVGALSLGLIKQF